VLVPDTVAKNAVPDTGLLVEPGKLEAWLDRLLNSASFGLVRSSNEPRKEQLGLLGADFRLWRAHCVSSPQDQWSR
jgi:hypothetical protein